VEFAAVFALSCFLFRIAVIWLKEMWWAVLLAGLLIAAVIAGYRIWKNNRYW
jgi:hypothetical protein